MRQRSFSLQAGEEVWALVRRHRIFLYVRIVLAALGIAVPLAGLWYGFARFGDLGQDSQLWSLVTVTAIWLAYWSVRLLFVRYRYHNEVWLVTDRRLVHVYRRHWLKGWANSVDLAEVGEVTVARSRPLGALLDYGDVRCWRADGHLALVMRGVARPKELQSIIGRLREKGRASVKESQGR
ncbi:MAG: hypothetical protein ACE5IZ_02500 [Dehalococcoidia bacterium]